MGFPFLRVLLFVALAGALAVYATWIYTRVELVVPAARRLAVVRSIVLAVVLLLLFDPRLPARGVGGAPDRWVLLDASLSMTALGEDGTTPWETGLARAQALEGQGWKVVRFGDGSLSEDGTPGLPEGLVSELAPALQAAAESGAREVRVVSDLRFADAVAIRSSMETVPLAVAFDAVGPAGPNAGISSLVIPDVLQPDDAPTAEVEVFGGDAVGDSIRIEILEEGVPVGRVGVAAPSPGLRARATLQLPVARATGRLRYTARVVQGGASADAFATDDEAVTYANIGHEAGALVLLSLAPDWELRQLLPVLEDVTGLRTVGYMRAGPDRYVRVGHAAQRGIPADSATVRRAATEASLLVVHGLGSDSEEWVSTLVGRPGRRLLLPTDADGAGTVGLEVRPPQEGEWYASPDIPTSPIAGSLSGVDFTGLPPLTHVLAPTSDSRLPPLLLQLRGAGAPEAAFELMDRPTGRVAVGLASGFWRWAMRDEGREAYRRVWSGVAGWLLADERVAASEARPSTWVVARGAPVGWEIPGDSLSSRLVVRDPLDETVADTVVSGGRAVSTSPLPPGSYTYSVMDAKGDTTTAGRFDVAANAPEMLPSPIETEPLIRAASARPLGDAPGRPLRTSPFPYLLVIILLCGEWVVRRRSGLR